MSNPNHERLLDLIGVARRRFGDDVLADPGRLVPWIADQAPELRPLARALAAALAAIAQGRVAAGADQREALAREAAESGAGPELARDAAELAQRAMAASGIASPPMPPPRTEWVGASEPVAAPAARPGPALAGMPQRYRAGAAVIAALVAIYLVGSREGADPASQPPSAAPAPAVPMLSAAPNGPLPTIPLRQQGQSSALVFDVPAPNAALRGMIAFPNQTWEGVQVAFGRNGAEQAETVSAPAAMALRAGQGGPMRVLRPRWAKDGLAAGELCVLFRQQDGADVQLRGSQLCLLEYVADDCRKVIGCGRVG